jgi:tetratricopeptide (TPR) repeat protein
VQSTAQQITISFAGFNRAWAAWIGHRLERQGCRVTFQRWNPPVEVPLEDALNDLLLVEGRILVVLSDWYFKLGPRTDEAWNEALRTVVAQNAHRFAAVSVDSQASMPSATTAFGGTAELWGVGAREAERRLLSALAITRGGTTTDSASTGVTPRYPHEQPRVWGGVPRRNTRFTGREDTLQQVYEILQRAEPGAGVVTLLGISGVGKTQVAAEYVFRFSSEYDVVWWVPADQRGTLRQRLAELAPSLGLTTGHEYGERLRAVAEALRRGSPYSRWLLVLDGADSPESVADMLPTGTGHVLITSQNREWGEHNTILYDIPDYDRDESVAFVRRRAPRIGAADADLLADALGDHPLALDQTAGWLSDSTVTIPQYVEMLRSGSDIEAALRISSDFPMTYYTAFSILLNRLRETAPEAVNVLRLCAFFAPGDIPVQLLRAIPAESLPEQLTGVMDDPVRWSTAVNKLVQYSVIQWNTPDADAGAEPEDAGTIYLHRMVSQTVSAGMSEGDRTTYSRAVRRGLTAADPQRAADPRNWPRYARIAPHLGASGALRSTNRHMRGLIFNSLRYFEAAGEYRGGIQLAERAGAAWRETYGEDHPEVWYLWSLHAMLLRNRGAYAQAEELDRVVVERFAAERGPRDLSVLRVQEGLGGDLRGLGQYQESLEISQDVLDGYMELIGEDDYRTLNARTQVATSLRLLGRYEEATAADRRTLALRREVLGPRHRLSLYSEIMYASDLRLLGRYDEARSVQEESLEVDRITLGKDHPYTMQSELNLALCLLRSGDRDTARSQLGDLMERSERVLGPDAPLAMRVAASYTVAEREHGSVDQAREIGERVVERYRAGYGPRHPYTVGTAANHAVLLRTTGELQSSQVLIEECLSGMVEALGPDHPWTLGVAMNVSAGRNREGDIEGALELSRDTERRAAEAVGDRHPLHLSSQVALALDLRALRRRTEADKVEGEALSGLSTTLGAQHVHTLSARSRSRPYWDFEPL